MPDTVELRDIELMRRLSAGDEDAFLEFYRRHQGGLYRYAVHMAGRPEAAADVVQETFLTSDSPRPESSMKKRGRRRHFCMA